MRLPQQLDGCKFVTPGIEKEELLNIPCQGVSILFQWTCRSLLDAKIVIGVDVQILQTKPCIYLYIQRWTLLFCRTNVGVRGIQDDGEQLVRGSWSFLFICFDPIHAELVPAGLHWILQFDKFNYYLAEIIWSHGTYKEHLTHGCYWFIVYVPALVYYRRQVLDTRLNSCSSRRSSTSLLFIPQCAARVYKPFSIMPL